MYQRNMTASVTNESKLEPADDARRSTLGIRKNRVIHRHLVRFLDAAREFVLHLARVRDQNAIGIRDQKNHGSFAYQHVEARLLSAAIQPLRDAFHVSHLVVLRDERIGRRSRLYHREFASIDSLNSRSGLRS